MKILYFALALFSFYTLQAFAEPPSSSKESSYQPQKPEHPRKGKTVRTSKRGGDKLHDDEERYAKPKKHKPKGGPNDDLESSGDSSTR